MEPGKGHLSRLPRYSVQVTSLDPWGPGDLGYEDVAGGRGVGSGQRSNRGCWCLCRLASPHSRAYEWASREHCNRARSSVLRHVRAGRDRLRRAAGQAGNRGRVGWLIPDHVHGARRGTGGDECRERLPARTAGHPDLFQRHPERPAAHDHSDAQAKRRPNVEPERAAKSRRKPVSRL